MEDGTVWIDIWSYLQTKYISINQDEKKWDFVLETFLIMAWQNLWYWKLNNLGFFPFLFGVCGLLLGDHWHRLDLCTKLSVYSHRVVYRSVYNNELDILEVFHETAACMYSSSTSNTQNQIIQKISLHSVYKLPFKYWKAAKTFSSPRKQAQFPQPSSIGVVLQPSEHPHGLLCTCSSSFIPSTVVLRSGHSTPGKASREWRWRITRWSLVMPLHLPL